MLGDLAGWGAVAAGLPGAVRRVVDGAGAEEPVGSAVGCVPGGSGQDMSGASQEGVVVDITVISWLFDERSNQLAGRYRELIGAAPALLAFQTVRELRFGALRAGWGRVAAASS